MTGAALPETTPNGHLSAVPRLAAARLDGGLLLLDGFREEDRSVVAYVEASAEPEAAVHRCLQVGARSLMHSDTSVDVETVDRAFGELQAAMAGQVEVAETSLKRLLDELFAPRSGQVNATLWQFRAELDEMLHTRFDPDARQGVLAQVEELLTTARREQVDALRAALDPTSCESPLGRYREEILTAVRRESEHVRRLVGELSERIAVERTRAASAERTSTKGVAFETLVHQAVSNAAVGLGDLAEQTGRVTGNAGSMKGDELVTVNPEDTAGRSARYVLEAKDRRVGMTAILDELAEAISNRGAGAGIAVFSSLEHAPTARPLTCSANKAIVVFDKDEQDPTALEVACTWARWVARRDLDAHRPDQIDTAAVEHALDDAVRELERLTTVRRCHGTMRKKLDEADGQLSSLQSEVESALRRARAAMDDADVADAEPRSS